MPGNDVLVVGGGIIGCSLALRLSGERLNITVIDKAELAREASWAAAGMLAPTAEHVHAPGEAELAAASAALYPGWIQELEARAGIETGYRREGSLLVAFDAKEADYWPALPGETLTAERARKLEPALSPRIIAARFLPGDHQLDPRALMPALVEAARRARVRFLTGTPVTDLGVESGRAVGVRLADGSELSAGILVNAAGSWACRLGEVGARLSPTRPIRGQIVCLRAPAPVLRHVVRSARAYIVPRADGRLLLGSTMEDVGYDKSLTPAGLRRILNGARELAPGLADLPFGEAWAGLRPDTPDHLPILGPTDIENYFVATGHYRNGILLAPITAQVMADCILGRKPSVSLEPFSPLRFAKK